MEIQKWILENDLILDSFEEGFVKLRGDDRLFFFLEDRKKIFDENLFFNLTEEEYEIIDKMENFNFLFLFGEEFYYSPSVKKEDEQNEIRYVVSLNEFKYIGECSKENVLNNYCGIHTEYELLNSALNFKNAIKKAKFLNVQRLGICDRNTLAATLPFQIECKKNNLKSIIGETVTVKHIIDGVESFNELKLFCINENSWKNLLQINKIINVDNGGKFILEEDVLKHGEDLICVFDYSNSILRDLRDETKYRKTIKKYNNVFKSVYYQFSTVEYSDERFDGVCLEGLKNAISYLDDDFSLLLIEDVYYLDKNQSDAKVAVNDILGEAKQHSFEQYFKTSRDSFEKISNFGDYAKTVFEFALENSNLVFNDLNFEIKVSDSKIPRYELEGEVLSDEESDGLFKMICEDGFEQKIINNKEINDDLLKVYRERLDYEMNIIIKAGFSGYFLIIWDSIQYVLNQDKLIGVGRGSVGGSLVSYVMNITRIDPIKCDLSFERFLNAARVEPIITYKCVMDNGEVFEIKKDSEIRTTSGELVKITNEEILMNIDIDEESLK